MSNGNQYTDELKEFKDGMSEFRGDLKSLSNDVREIKVALLGTDYGDEGLVTRIIRAEDKIRSLEEYKTKAQYYALGLGAGSGTLVIILKELLF